VKQDRSPRFRRAALPIVGVVTTAVVLASCGSGKAAGPHNRQNALRPAGPNAQKILNLTRPFFWIAVLVGLFVGIATVYAALRFREKPGEERRPVQVHGNIALEISWTIIPALILAVMGVFTVAGIFDLAKKPTGPDVVHVTVTARQWWWQFTYTDKGNGVETANELHIPVNQPVYLSLVGPPKCVAPCYGVGVIHSFWIPELNGKKDVVPGRTQYLTLEASRTGTFLGQCAEYCGLSHANMRMRVIAQSKADYDAWVASQQVGKSQADLLKGVQAAQWGCAGCHSFEPKKPGAVGPNLVHLADRDGFAGDMYRMNFSNLWQWVYDAPGRKPMGNLKEHMPAFLDTPSATTGKTMTQDDAKQIACFLLTQTKTGGTEQPVVGQGSCK
jgi:cytochrome c oxidase subunit 2